MKFALTLFTLILSSDFALAAIGINLVVNGNAETGNTVGWDSSGGLEVVPATGLHAGFGSFTFTGGPGPLAQGMSQSIDISDHASKIDKGELTFIFSIQLQSRNTNVASAVVNFIDENDSILDTLYFFDNINLQLSDWNEFSSYDVVPVSTRVIEITLLANRAVGSLTDPIDAFFDEVQLSLASAAQPASKQVPFPHYAVILFGVSAVALSKRLLKR